MQPEVRYADSHGVQIAYQVIGDGPIDIVFAFDWASNVELVWGFPAIELFLHRMTPFSRVILFDPRGMGLSDPVAEPPSPEQWMDDVRAIMDAAGSERAAVIGHGHGGQLGLVFAASHPERTQALVTINAFARLARADDYPWGMPPEVQQATIEAIKANWGSGFLMQILVPDYAEERTIVRRWATIERTGGSPRRAADKQRKVFATDVRHLLPGIAAPTLVIQTARNDFVRRGHGRYLAEHIPGASYVELPGRGHWPWVSDAEPFMDAIEEFLTGARAGAVTDRRLATVVFSDIVDSTRLAAAFGDRRWQEVLDIHDSVARREVELGGGRLTKSTGDGFLATFDGPARAIRAVRAIAQDVGELGLEIRAGLHAGEIEMRDGDISGIAVHIAARIAALARPGQVLVSSTVKDLVIGSGLAFMANGAHELKGVPERWHLFAVAHDDTAARPEPAL
jgi:class 3 adenylate cyclase/pimeloyl-ACP methyl ester carboxylesterase